MAKADRLERMDGLRIDLEAEYRAALIAALRKTASGSLGIFGHNPDRHQRAKAAALVEPLFETAERIDDLRDKLGLEPFALHQQFLASRGPVKADAVGEPKQAKAWLERLEAEG